MAMHSLKEKHTMRRFPFAFADNVGCPLGRVAYAGIKWDSNGAPWLSPMRTNEAHLLVYTLEGRARYVDDSGLDRVMGQGCLFLLPPGLAHAYLPLSAAPWSEFHMWLTGPIWDLWLRAGSGPEAVLFLEGLPVAHWLDRLMQATAPTEPQTPAASWQRLAQIQSVLAGMMEAAEQAGSEEEAQGRLGKARKILEQGQLCEPSLQEVAHTIGMAYETFRKRFTEAVGVSPGRYRTRHVMRHACRMLTEERSTIQETAARLGFSDEFHFSRRFKSTIGVAPSVFRKSGKRRGM
jgi:AraC-like DNA-binding protein